jgi:hypothetical protein
MRVVATFASFLSGAVDAKYLLAIACLFVDATTRGLA